MAKKVLTKDVLLAIDKINAIKDEIGTFVKEKEDVLDLITLALVSKRNAFFLGKTGQAKSLVVTEVIKRIDGANYFGILMSKMIDSEQIFGRLDIPQLVQGTQKIITDGKTPEAHINFFDEIFKSSEVLLNSLLQILNFEEINLEGNIIKPPTISTFSASNEIPNWKKEEEKILYPLYDRLHLKMVTNYVEKKENMKEILKQKRARAKQNSNPKATMHLNELLLLNKKALEIEFPEEIDDLMIAICEQIKTELGKEISDRKKFEYSILCQSWALLNKRESVIPDDLKVLRWYLWDQPEEVKKIEDIIKQFAENPLKDKIMEKKVMATEIIEEALQVIKSGDIKAKNRSLNKAENELIQIYVMLEGIEKDAKTLDDKKMVTDAIESLEAEYKNMIENMGYTYISLKETKERKGL